MIMTCIPVRITSQASLKIQLLMLVPGFGGMLKPPPESHLFAMMIPFAHFLIFLATFHFANQGETSRLRTVPDDSGS